MNNWLIATLRAKSVFTYIRNNCKILPPSIQSLNCNRLTCAKSSFFSDSSLSSCVCNSRFWASNDCLINSINSMSWLTLNKHKRYGSLTTSRGCFDSKICFRDSSCFLKFCNYISKLSVKITNNLSLSALCSCFLSDSISFALSSKATLKVFI